MNIRKVISCGYLLWVLGCLSACGILGTSTARELSLYEESDDPKPLASYLHSEEGYSEADLAALVEWSLENRWQFLKFVDHLKGRKRSDFMKTFPLVLAKSEHYEAFRNRYAASPSRSIRTLLDSAEAVVQAK